MEDMRDNDNRKTVAEMVAAIDRRTARTEEFLFGHPGQEYNAWIPRTDRRLDDLDAKDGRVTKVENRLLIWAGALTIVAPAAAYVVSRFLK